MSVHLPQNIAATVYDQVAHRLDQMRHELATGVATDYPDYRYRCGYAIALANVLDYFEDARKALQEGKS